MESPSAWLWPVTKCALIPPPRRACIKGIDSNRSDVLVQERVDKGELGAKTGKGFLDWTPETAEATRWKMANAFIEIEKWSEDGV